jgi:hypothetical protein
VSHSKTDRIPFLHQNPDLWRFIVRCSGCGREGLDASVNWEDNSSLGGWNPGYKTVLRRRYEVLPLNADSLCEVCASVLARLSDPS